MPELPEVESVRRQLAPLIEGRRFERVEVSDPRLTRPLDPAFVARSLEGERVAVLDRRGKYLIVRFESGRALLIHLRMTGSLQHARGIERQGSTLRDYRLPNGESGGMQREFKVYGREGEPCARCGTPIEKIRLAGRGTWYCPACQRAPSDVPQAASSSSRRPSRS